MSSIFDILGPIMVGPSSSHTAGAVRIGRAALKLLQDELVFADIKFSGSFAATGRGHGTDCAITAGLMDMLPDDMRIPGSLGIAEDRNIRICFSDVDIEGAHPNTVLLNLQGKSGRRICVQASSVGGGRIMINKIDGISVNFTGEMPVLIVHNTDEPGHVAGVTSLLSANRINIAAMQLYRNEKGGYAVMVIESDQKIPQKIVSQLENFHGIIKVTYLNMEQTEK